MNGSVPFDAGMPVVRRFEAFRSGSPNLPLTAQVNISSPCTPDRSYICYIGYIVIEVIEVIEEGEEGEKSDGCVSNKYAAQYAAQYSTHTGMSVSLSSLSLSLSPHPVINRRLIEYHHRTYKLIH